MSTHIGDLCLLGWSDTDVADAEQGPGLLGDEDIVKIDEEDCVQRIDSASTGRLEHIDF